MKAVWWSPGRKPMPKSQINRRDRQKVPCPGPGGESCGRMKLPQAKLCRMCDAMAKLRVVRPGIASNEPITLSEEQITLARERRARGWTWAATATVFGMSVGTLKKLIGQVGPTSVRRPDYKPLPTDGRTLLALRRAYQKGASIPALVEQFGGGPKTVRAYLVSQGVEIRGRGARGSMK